MVTVNETGREMQSELLLEDDDHDGWGPIRPRRSSMPPDGSSDPHARDTLPIQCATAEDDQETQR